MSETTAITKQMEQQFQEVEGIIADCQLALRQNGGRISKAMAMARGIIEIRKRFTPEVMRDLMALRDTPLGFMTDRNPALINWKTNKPNIPYSEDEVRECMIEHLLRGGYPVNNEMNIIASRAYAAKNFFLRAIAEVEGVTNVRKIPGVPKVMGDAGAIVPFKVTWAKNGVKDEIELMIPVKTNKGMGIDAIIGKATRKALKAAYEQMTGSDLIPDGEVEDAPGMVDAKVVTPGSESNLNDLMKGDEPTEGDEKSIDGKPLEKTKPADTKPTADEKNEADHQNENFRTGGRAATSDSAAASSDSAKNNPAPKGEAGGGSGTPPVDEQQRIAEAEALGGDRDSLMRVYFAAAKEKHPEITMGDVVKQVGVWAIAKRCKGHEQDLKPEDKAILLRAIKADTFSFLTGRITDPQA
jgi:hypothetical protein